MTDRLQSTLQKLPGIGKIISISQQGFSQWATLYKLITAKDTLFLKCTTTPNHSELSLVEVKNLNLLDQSQTIPVPKVIAHISKEDFSAILMEYVDSQRPPSESEFRRAGRRLAELHRHSASSFGLSYNNYIGNIPQFNDNVSKTVANHYINDRLAPLLLKALSKDLLSANETRKIESIYKRIEELVPEEPPALIHGDLWGGNIIANTKKQDIYFIDPATAFSIREMDIAMSLLFGGFHEAFYEGYNEVYPLFPEWQKRIPLFQLYYLLIHLLLFGTSYKNAVMQSIKPYQ